MKCDSTYQTSLNRVTIPNISTGVVPQKNDFYLYNFIISSRELM